MTLTHTELSALNDKHYKSSLFKLKKAPDRERARAIIDATHDIIQDLLGKQFSHEEPKTALDLAFHLEGDTLTEEDKAELERLPEPARTKLKTLFSKAA